MISRSRSLISDSRIRSLPRRAHFHVRCYRQRQVTFCLGTFINMQPYGYFLLMNWNQLQLILTLTFAAVSTREIVVINGIAVLIWQVVARLKVRSPIFPDFHKRYLFINVPKSSHLIYDTFSFTMIVQKNFLEM